ncbi:RcpC/CpaB family pilus assembly protein [Streptomyces sp. NPDC058295]|uniref:RcpC/CpaB family pilus assembly protein n=1 Tax=Streptomyces sp. NPDC058295 TaxID=3346431 RepID=UPI0036EFD9ED
MSDSLVPPSPLSPLPPLPPLPSPASSPLSYATRPPGTEAPATCEVPPFAPVRVRGGRYRLGRLVRSRRRALALGLAITAAALVASGLRDGDPARGHPGGAMRADAGGRSHPRAQAPLRAPAHDPRAGAKVAAPVRIADAATVRLLRPGDRVDVIAAEPTPLGGVDGTGGDAHVVARGALVTKVPEPLDTDSAAGPADDGALVVLSVPRSTAARLAGASATARLAVTLW